MIKENKQFSMDIVSNIHFLKEGEEAEKTCCTNNKNELSNINYNNGHISNIPIQFNEEHYKNNLQFCVNHNNYLK